MYFIALKLRPWLDWFILPFGILFLIAYFLLNKMKTYSVVSRVLILDQLLSST
jgi:hypothetical protein